jgi:hypothetical protein
VIRHRLFIALLWTAACSLAHVPLAAAAGGEAEGVAEVVLPGGLAAARSVLHDRTRPFRALFLPEFIERFYDTPRDAADNEQPELQAFLAYLDRASRDAGTSSDTIPLPIGVSWWTDTVFHGRATADTLVLEILRSRDAALLYWGLLAVDPPTRTWLASERGLVGLLLSGRAPLLVVATPGVRVSGGRFVLPGGEPLRDAWETLVGAKVTDPARVLARVVGADDGALAYFVGRMARFDDGTVQALLRTPGATAAERAASLERLYDVFRRAARGWDVPGRPFSAMPDDPALLLADLEAEGDHRMAVCGDERFWAAVFDAEGDPSRLPKTLDARFEPGSVDPVWLLDQVVRPVTGERRLRGEQVLFASRAVAPGPASTRDAAVAVAALGAYPALVRTLERLGIHDAAVLRATIDRALALRSISDAAAEVRATAAFQGTLALVVSATARGTLPRASLADILTSLAGVPTSADGDYEGRLAAWIDAHLRRSGAPGIDADLVRLLAAFPAVDTSLVEWEGTRYRSDLGYAEARRLDRVRGDPPPFLPTAWAILDLATRLDREAPAAADAGSTESRVDETLRTLPLDPGDDGKAAPWEPLAAITRRRLRDLGRHPTPVEKGAAVLSLRRLADDLVARGLAELAYAAALGGSDQLPIGSAEAARRHDFGILRQGEPRGTVAWRLPLPSVRVRGPWHIEGALLALDVSLAESRLRRISLRPRQAAPTMDRADRRALAQVVITIDPAALADADRDRLAAAIREGRRRLASLASAGDLEAAVSTLPLDPLRRTLLPWMFERERDLVASSFSVAEMFRVGGGESLPVAVLDAWGAPARPRLGCLCLQFPTRARSAYAGHLSSGILMSALPDLNLRLAEWMSELQMPASLVPSVLAAATLEVIDRAPSRFRDDLRAVAEQVDRVSLDDAEQYLSLLTTDGPLVPLDESPTSSEGNQP